MSDTDTGAAGDDDSDLNESDDDWTYDPNSGASPAAQAGFPDSPYPLYPGDPDQMTDDERTVFTPIDDINSTAPPNPAGLQPLLTVGSTSPYLTGQLDVSNLTPTTYDTGSLVGANGGLSGGGLQDGALYGGPGNDPLVTSAYQPTAGDYRNFANNIVGQSTGVGNVTAASGGPEGVAVTAKPLSIGQHLLNIGGDLVHLDFNNAGQETGVVANKLFGSPQNGEANYYGIPGGGFHPSDGIQSPADLGSQQHALASSTGNSVGIWGGGSAEGGLVAGGSAGQGSLAGMMFPNGETALLGTYGGHMGGPGYGITFPATAGAPPLANTNGGMVGGRAYGVGGGLLISNALTPNDLVGPATAYNMNVGPFGGSLSLDNHGHYVLSAGLSKGRALDFSEYPTDTEIIWKK